jgi:hypothetical protein
MFGLNLNSLAYCFDHQVLGLEILHINFNFVQVTIDKSPAKYLETLLESTLVDNSGFALVKAK